MDLLHFDPQPLYFEDPLPEGVHDLIEEAGRHYGQPEAEALLARAAAAAPDHLVVLVARYRYFFYQHRIAEAQDVVWHAIAVSGAQLGLPADGTGLSPAKVAAAAKVSMTLTRFYLSSIKAAAYVKMRLDEIPAAIALLQALVEIDEADRMGGKVLLDIAHARQRGESDDSDELETEGIL